MTNRSEQSHIDEMIQMLTDRGCTPISVTKKSVKMVYICRCGEERSQTFNDFKRRTCRKCKSLGLIDNDDDLDPKQIDIETGEIWLRIKGGWISSFGRAKRRFNSDQMLKLYENGRYSFNGEKPYARRLVAITFQIEGYELLTNPDGTSNQNWSVSMRDTTMTTPQPGYLQNLYVRSKEDVGRQNGKLSGKVKPQKSYRPSDFAHLKRRVLPDVLSEKHIIYENGEIYNGTRFLQFSKPTKGKYYSITNILGSGKSYKVHRLVCYAFHPIEGYTCLEDYKHLQVNHIDGNTLNNHKDNLEWADQSANMSHAYRSGLNKKVRGILQYKKGTNNLIAEYPSIAEASRQTGESEHNIREFARQKAPCRKRIYDWKFANPEESEEYSRKYRSYK